MHQIQSIYLPVSTVQVSSHSLSFLEIFLQMIAMNKASGILNVLINIGCLCSHCNKMSGKYLSVLHFK